MNALVRGPFVAPPATATPGYAPAYTTRYKGKTLRGSTFQDLREKVAQLDDGDSSPPTTATTTDKLAGPKAAPAVATIAAAPTAATTTAQPRAYAQVKVYRGIGSTTQAHK